MSLEDIYVPVPGTCESVGLHGKESLRLWWDYFRLVINWPGDGAVSRTLGGPRVTTGSSYLAGWGADEIKACLALAGFEEQSRGTQVSGNWERKANRLSPGASMKGHSPGGTLILVGELVWDLESTEVKDNQLVLF